MYGDLKEEVYMEQPPGYVASGEGGHVCLLKRSLYSLKQSPFLVREIQWSGPRAWIEMMSEWSFNFL